MTAHRPVAGLVLSFIAHFILLVTSPIASAWTLWYGLPIVNDLPISRSFRDIRTHARATHDGPNDTQEHTPANGWENITAIFYCI